MCLDITKLSNNNTNDHILYNLCQLGNNIDQLSFEDKPDYKGYVKLLWNIE